MPNSIRSFFIIALFTAIFAGCASQNIPVKSKGYIDAMELKLKCRELADQMLATVPNDALKGFVAMPTTFVNENDTSRSSALGRLIAESMFYEFNQRGFPTREYRLTGKIDVTGGKNDLALAANQVVSTKNQKWAALVVGTYYVDKDATFINARLVRAADGLVLRTAQLVIPNTPLILRMAAADPVASGSANSAAGKKNPATNIKSAMGSGSIMIVQGK